MRKRVCEAWYSVELNVLEVFTIQCQEKLQISLKQREMQRNTDFMIWAYNVVVFSLEYILNDVVVFFIEMYLIFIYNCCLIVR